MFCASCGQLLPPAARFCPSCAAPVSTAPPQPQQEERKLATVLFADLVGSTALAESTDPERTRALLNRFYEAMAGEIEEAGGTVEKFVGDAVMAAFGAPAALEDHAERALHAALSMQRRLDESFGDTLSLRIGVNTGEVVVGQPRQGSSFVSGDTVNVAARLEQAAQPGEILVGQRTAAAAGGAFEFDSPVTVEAKGKPEGVACCRLVRELSLMRPRGVGGMNRAFVGRERELDALRTTFARTLDEAEPSLVMILGDVGVGKTTLIREFWEWLASEPARPSRRVGRCAPYGTGIAYAPLGEIVREHLGLLEGDAPETVRSRLGAREMLGVTLGLEPPADLHPLAAGDRLHQAWVSFLDELVAEFPAVVLVEDVHWADEVLLALLDAGLEDAQGPLLLLVTARPELTHDALTRRRRDRSETIWLEPLSSTESAQMLDELVPTELPRTVRDDLIQRAEGNPFFVEELVRTLIDQGVLARRNGGWMVDQPPGELVIPDTVQAVLAARIDLLGPTEKAALQAAAVIGRTFWSGPVYELLEGLEPDLRVLEERDFIRRRPTSSLVGEREFAIKHALTRQVAYDSLPKARRARLHARFADWLERTGEGRDEHAPLLSHHYWEAVRPEDADLVWDDDEAEAARLRRSAVTWLRRAGELAVRRYEIEEALALLERALALEPPRAEQLELWEEVAHANALFFDGDGFSKAIQRAIDLSRTREQTADLIAELAFQTMVRSGMWRVLPDPQLVDGWIESALEVADVDSTRAKALIARCYHDYRKSPELAQEASDIAERLGDARLRSYSFDVLGLTAFSAGQYDDALAWQRERVGLVHELDDPDHQADIYANAIPPAIALCEFEEARQYTEEQLELTGALSPHHRLHGISAAIELEELLGNWGGIRERQAEVEQAVADNAATPCVRNERSLLVCALANAYEGDERESRRLEELADAQGMQGYGTVVGAPRQQLALHRGDTDAAARLLGDPAVRRTTWFLLSSLATHFDALAALGKAARIEAETRRHLQPGRYLEPFALRALGFVRNDEALVGQAASRFDALGLAWHAARTRSAR